LTRLDLLVLKAGRARDYGFGTKSSASTFRFMKRAFADVATAIAYQSGRPVAFSIAAIIIVTWAITGPIFHFSDTWQLIINTGTTIITFLMVFVIQNTQNRDGAAIQAKLDELIRVSAARNSLIGIETLTQDEIAEIRAACAARAKKTTQRADRKAAAGEALSQPAVKRPQAARHSNQTSEERRGRSS
jgi:low affinity Fe/Cu permease